MDKDTTFVKDQRASAQYRFLCFACGAQYDMDSDDFDYCPYCGREIEEFIK